MTLGLQGGVWMGGGAELRVGIRPSTTGPKVDSTPANLNDLHPRLDFDQQE